MPIKSEIISVGKMFTDMWFRIPEYQRPYVWGKEQISELLGDISYAMRERQQAEYFLGSFVYSSTIQHNNGVEFYENDVLDGQQRITTLLLIFSVLRDLVSNEQAVGLCQGCIAQTENTYKNIPERPRIIFGIREDAQEFLAQLTRLRGFTSNQENLSGFKSKECDVSIKNMVLAIESIVEFFKGKEDILDNFITYVYNNVVMIYISTDNLEDAFRLFTIINDRGVNLRNSDILKAINLGALTSDKDKKRYAKLWEETESELGDDFDRFLNYIRTILLKDKARFSLLREYEEKIYSKNLLQKGRESCELINRYFSHYTRLTSGNNYEIDGSYQFDNLIKVMMYGLPSTDWLPPLLKFYDKFGTNGLYKFLELLDKKFSADWIIQLTPTTRIESMNDIIKEIDNIDDVNIFLKSYSLLMINKDELFKEFDCAIYGRRFAKYILLKMDFLLQNHAQRMHFETLSLEHILPQNPSKDSRWVKDFSDQDRENNTDKLGNLVLITRNKNAALGRLDFSEKKTRYFERNIDTCPNSLRIWNAYNEWTPSSFQKKSGV